jgi:aminoglycoside phosphotransferase (APT) family kinase protein
MLHDVRVKGGVPCAAGAASHLHSRHVPHVSARVVTGQTDGDAWSDSRATDWRYLLPPARDRGIGRILLAGATDAVTAAVRQAGLAEEIYRESCPPAVADAAVVFRGSDLSISAVAAMLAPGGALYWEISRTRRSRLRLTPAAARAVLELSGMSHVESYWVTSGKAGPSMHLPLSRDGAVDWYFSTHHGPSSRLRRSLGRALRTLTRGRGRRLERIVPVFALTARRADPAGTKAADGATALATGDVPPWARALDATPILLGGGEGPWSRVVLLPFGRGADRPSGVIKIARLSAYESSLVAEQATLATLRAAVPAFILPSLPEPLGPVRVLGQPGSAEAYRPGASIAVRSTRPGHRATRRADLERAADWLLQLHDATASAPRTLGPTGFDLAGLTDQYASVFGSNETEDRWFRRLREFAVEDADPVPVVTRHRDFGPWNVLVDADGQVSVIDWEVAGPGPPLVDLVYFVSHWCWIVAASSSVQREAQLLRRFVVGERSGWYLQAARSVIARHARSLGFAPGRVAALWAWTFIEQALDRHDRLMAIGVHGAADRSSNRYVRYVAALAEVPDLAGAIAGWLDPDQDPGT